MKIDWKRVIAIVGLMLAVATAKAQTNIYLNLDAQHSDYYFSEGGLGFGISVQEKLNNISERLVSDLGVGVFFDQSSAIGNEAKFNTLVGVGYVFKTEGVSAVILKANWRGYLIDDVAKGYFEPTAEVKINNDFSINFSYASEIHPYGFNIPTGRLGLRFRIQ